MTIAGVGRWPSRLAQRRRVPRDSREPTFDVSLEVGADDDLTSPMLDGFSLRVASIVGR